jgi:hypothetical protein
VGGLHVKHAAQRGILGTNSEFSPGLSVCQSVLYYDRRSVGQSILVSSPHLGLMTRFLLLSDNCGFVDMGRPLWREYGSVFYNVQCTIYNKFYCLRFESMSLYLYPPGRGWPGYTPRHWVWCTPLWLFSRIAPTSPVIISWHAPRRKHRSFIVTCVFIAVGTCLPSCCLEMVT